MNKVKHQNLLLSLGTEIEINQKPSQNIIYSSYKRNSIIMNTHTFYSNETVSDTGSWTTTSDQTCSKDKSYEILVLDDEDEE